MLQTLRSIKMATVIVTNNARKIVAPRRIRAATQPPIAVVVRNTIGARPTRVAGSGETTFEIIKSAANFSVPMRMYTPIAMLTVMKQFPLRSEDQTMDGTERQG